jgi:hypothetical protein
MNADIFSYLRSSAFIGGYTGVAMPPAINTLHLVLTVLAFGILFGVGWALAQLAVAWPGSRVSGAATVIALLLLALAWIVP